MKRILNVSFFLIFSYFVFINAFTVKALAPYPYPYVAETTIAGIVPIGDENIIVNQATFDLDFNTPTGIDVDKMVERSAHLKMTYDLTYTESNGPVWFSLPLLNKLSYIDQGAKVFVDGIEVEPTLYISTQFYYSYFRGYLGYWYEGSFTSKVEHDFLTEYREAMLKDYTFKNDVEGYQYTVKTPKTQGDNYFSITTLRVINPPVNNSVFLDTYYPIRDGKDVTFTWHHQKSEEEVVFFSSSNLLIEGESIEMKLLPKGYYEYIDSQLDNPTIVKEEMRLSEYIEKHLSETSSFLDTRRQFLYYSIDLLWEEVDTFPNFPLQDILNNTYSSYYEMSLEFAVDFYKPQMQVEILLPIPIHCNRGEMVLKVVANPALKISEFGDFHVYTHIDEKLIFSSETYRRENIDFWWLIDGNNTLEIVYKNSLYKPHVWSFVEVLALLFLFVLGSILYNPYSFLLFIAIIVTHFIIRMKMRDNDLAFYFRYFR